MATINLFHQTLSIESTETISYDIMYETSAGSENSVEIDPNTIIVSEGIVYAKVTNSLGIAKNKIDGIASPTNASTISVKMRFMEPQNPDISKLPINEIKSCGQFSSNERADEYRRRGKFPSGVIDGKYNDENRGNDEYTDKYRDWKADA